MAPAAAPAAMEINRREIIIDVMSWRRTGGASIVGALLFLGREAAALNQFLTDNDIMAAGRWRARVLSVNSCAS